MKTIKLIYTISLLFFCSIGFGQMTYYDDDFTGEDGKGSMNFL